MVPFASHAGVVGRDAVQTTYTPGHTEVAPDGQVRTYPSRTSTPDPGARTQYGLLGLSLGHDWVRVVRTEMYAALIVMEAPRPRGLFGLRAGPILRLLDRSSTKATSAALRFVPMGGIAYRGQMYEWLHASDWRGQRSLALTFTPALEATYYSSRSLGWTIRLKPEFSYVVDQIGSSVWIPESGAQWDGYRWGLTGGIDLGVVF
jgi:hypothetical protein